jgi:hypothetical protein
MPAQFEHWYRVDLNEGPVKEWVKNGTFTQDNMANLIGVKVYRGPEPVTLEGTITLYVIRNDGNTVVCTGSIDNNKAWVELPESAYACPGTIQMAMRLTNGNTKTVLAAIWADVKETSTDAIIDPGHVIPDIDDLQAQIERMEQRTAAAEEAAENAVAAVGAPFDETDDYVYGDYVTHNGSLYMATEDVTAGSPFNPGQWQKINVMDTVGTAVLYTPQALSSAQRLQAAENIDVLTKGWGQTLTADQKQAVRDKAGLPFIDWDTNWTDAQKAQARKNLNAADIGNAKTPEMYGAKGDGVTDDGNALLSAFSEASAAGVPLVFTYGKTYAIGRFVQMTGHRINVYGNGATIKVLTGTSTLNEVLYISDDNDGQFPDSKGKGLIENLTIDCNGLAKCGIHIGMAKGYELQNLDICGFTEKGLLITSGFEIFCHNIRIAGSGIAGSVGLRMNTSDSRFVNIVTKNVAVGIENHGAANNYTHVHAWNTLAAIAPTSIMFDSYADLHASDCYVDTCSIGIYQHSDDPVEVNSLTIVTSGSLMSNTPTVFKLADPSYAARIHSTGMVYLSDADYNMFEADVSQYAKDYDWLGNNDSSTHSMGNMPNAYAITEEIADLKTNLVLVQSTQPTAEENRIWIPTEQGEEVEVPTYEEFEDVKSAFKAYADTVDALSLFVNYNDIASFTLTPAAIEIGNATASVTLAWTFYATPASLTLNGVSKSVSSSGETVTATDDGSTHQVTYTLATSIGSKTEAFHFYPNLYWGVSSTAGSPTSAFVIGLASKQLSGSKAKTFTVNAGSGQYIYFCSPVRYGQCAFKSGGFEGGFEAAQTVSVTNASGHTENYYVYRSTNPGLGSTTITVS